MKSSCRGNPRSSLWDGASTCLGNPPKMGTFGDPRTREYHWLANSVAASKPKAAALFMTAFVVIAVGDLSGAQGQTVSFSPIQPATCPSYTEANWRYQVGGGTGVWESAADLNTNESTYLSNIRLPRTILGNIYTSRFGFRVATFQTEWGTDQLEYRTRPTSAAVLTGSESPGWREIVGSGGVELSTEPGVMTFRTDPWFGAAGFNLDRARVCFDGSSGPQGYPSLTLQERNNGVLLGPNDVIYASVAGAPSNVHTTFALWGGGPDIDLYVRCGAVPTPTEYTKRSINASPQEFIHLNPTECPPNTTMFIAVNQYSGGASFFNLVVHQHYSAYHYGTALADTNWPGATAPQYDAWSTAMKEGFKRYFGATEGVMFWEKLELWNTGGSFYPIRFNPWVDRASAGICSGVLNMYLGDDGRVLMHEAGHFNACLADEYNTTNSNMGCQHSIMANPYNSVHNLCYCDNWFLGSNYPTLKCEANHGNHNWDPVPQTQNPAQNGPAWSNLQNRTPVRVVQTPDNYDYVDFSFNGIYNSTVP
jgi:hypothetical protein